MNLQFSLDAWSAWAPDKTTRHDWEAWARDEEFIPAPGVPDLSVVPAPQRRRMSSLSRMAVATACACAEGVAGTPCCVFASRHGELSRTVKIIESLVAGGDVSPTDFSLSVFNTALGLYSIVAANQAPSTMVVAGEDTFGCALIEAALTLARFPGTPVLLVCFDEPLPEPLDLMDAPDSAAFSLALLLRSGPQPNVAVSFRHHDGGAGEPQNPGLDFLKFWLAGQQRGSIRSARTEWQWSRL